MSHYRDEVDITQLSTSLRNLGTGADFVGFGTLQGVDPASPANRLEARTSTQPSFARYEFGRCRKLGSETCGLTSSENSIFI